MTGRHVAVWLLFVALAILGAIAFCAPARSQSGAHGDGHAQHHDKYKQWQRPDIGGSCCNALTPDSPSGDCRPTVGYLGDDGWWRARIKPGPNGFVSVPPAKLVPRDPDGRCHVCERNGSVLCFAPCDPRS